MNKNQYQNHTSTFIENFEIFAGWLQPVNFRSTYLDIKKY